MKIKIGDVGVATLAGSPGPHEVIDMDDEVAQDLVNAGLASLVGAPKKTRKTAEKAVSKAKAEQAAEV